MNMSQKNLDALLSVASKQLGMTPDELKKNLSSGNMSGVTQKMGSDDGANLQRFMTDKNFAEKIMSTPEAQSILKKLSAKKD